jgi:hypothetical protein
MKDVMKFSFCRDARDLASYQPNFVGGIRGRIKRLGWSPCALFFCLFPVQDDALTSSPTGQPAAALYRPLYVWLPYL